MGGSRSRNRPSDYAGRQRMRLMAGQTRRIVVLRRTGPSGARPLTRLTGWILDHGRERERRQWSKWNGGTGRCATAPPRTPRDGELNLAKYGPRTTHYCTARKSILIVVGRHPFELQSRDRIGSANVVRHASLRQCSSSITTPRTQTAPELTLRLDADGIAEAFRGRRPTKTSSRQLCSARQARSRSDGRER
jgi:hypothetical protein